MSLEDIIEKIIEERGDVYEDVDIIRIDVNHTHFTYDFKRDGHNNRRFIFMDEIEQYIRDAKIDKLLE